MSNIKLGQLEKVDLRNVWANEAGDFSPWLAQAENLALLADTLHLDGLELDRTEVEVGPYRADIVCQETASDRVIVIENQLEKTDHDHLGKLLTYAAGLKAEIVVWVAARFTDEHRAALDWLNNASSEEFAFFGVEIEAWRIGDSAPAPKFNVIARPNDWSRQVASVSGPSALTDKKRLQLEFWIAFRAWAEIHAKRFSPTKAKPQHWMNMGIGRGGFNLGAIASHWDSMQNTFARHEIRAELQLHNKEAKEQLQTLQEDQATIDSELGEPLIWHESSGRSCRIYLRREVDLNDRASWDEYHEWLTNRLDKLHEVFSNRIQKL